MLRPIIDANHKSFHKVFKEILDNMLRQGEPCHDKQSCLYSRKGKHCAIGFLLEPTDAVEAMTGDVNELIHEVLLSGINYDFYNHYHNRNFICHYADELMWLQNIHDLVSPTTTANIEIDIPKSDVLFKSLKKYSIQRKIKKWFKINNVDFPESLEMHFKELRASYYVHSERVYNKKRN